MQHLTRKLLQLALISLIQLFSLSRAEYQLQVRAVSYENPSGRRSNGDCCDFSIFSCSNDCDTHLEFCFRPPGYSDAANEECPLGSLIAGPVGGDSITFGDSVGSLSNPFTLDIEESWLGSFQMLVEVFDTDDITNDDFIDVIFGAPFNLSIGHLITQTYSGRRASITLTFQASCSDYYYGPECNVFCEETDSATKGHYTCDPQTGEKVCRPGYTDPMSNCITAITEEPITTNSATTTVTITSTGDDSASGSMATATIPTTGSHEPTGTSTNTEPDLGVLSSSSSSTTPGSVSDSPLNPDVNIAANQDTSKRNNNIGVIAGPLVAITVVIATIIVALVIVLICKRRGTLSKSDDLTERMLSSFNDGIPNATYDPTATGVVYAAAGQTNTERNFNNPLYHSIQLTGDSGAAVNHDSIVNGGHLNDEDNDSKSSSGLYSTIDHRSPNRVWALRPPQNGQYSVITDPH